MERVVLDEDGKILDLSEKQWLEQVRDGLKDIVAKFPDDTEELKQARIEALKEFSANQKPVINTKRIIPKLNEPLNEFRARWEANR